MKLSRFKEISKVVDNMGYSLLSKIDSIDIHKIKIKDKKTDKIYITDYYNLKAGHLPSKRNPRLSEEEVKQNISSWGYTLLSTYKNSASKILVANPNGDTYETNYSSLRSGKKPERLNKKYTYDEAKSIVESKGYTLVSNYIGYTSPLKIKLGGDTYQTTLSGLIQGKRPERRIRKNTGKSIKEELAKYGYQLIGEYNDLLTPVTVKCIQGHQWVTLISNIRRGSLCPRCATGYSKGEKLIFYLLERNGITFDTQKEVIIGDKLHKLDFYVTTKDGHYVIEYDGPQHHRASTLFGGELGLNYRKLRDEEKNEYCLKNNIKMIRVSYNLESLEDISKFISSEGLYLPSINGDINAYASRTETYISNYYLEHSLKETTDKFKLHRTTVSRYFKDCFGVVKYKYINESVEELLSLGINYYDIKALLAIDKGTDVKIPSKLKQN